MKTKAAIAWQAGQPLTVEEVDLEGPKAGEVLVEIKATGICHTDYYTLSGADPEGIFPAILGHEGAGVVVEVGAGVTTVKKDDHVIPLYTPECRQCKFCLSRKTNLCQAIRSTQGRGLMPDATSRFSIGGKPLFHYMGTSTFSNYIVVPEIALANIRKDAPFDTACYIGCGVTTGVGAVVFSAKVEAGANVVVFGLGGIGLNVIQAAKMVGANKIIGVDINPARIEMARVRHDRLHQPERSGERGRPHRAADRRRRRLFVRVHRQHHHDAPGARVLPQGLGPVVHHRRGGGGAGNQHPAVPAGDRARVERFGLRRRARPHRRAEDRRLVHGRQAAHRRTDHAPLPLERINEGFDLMKRGESIRSVVLY